MAGSGPRWQIEVAFYLSLAASVSSAALWWRNEVESRKTVAIDFSFKYLLDKQISDGKKALESLSKQVRNDPELHNGQPAERDDAVRYMRTMEFTAYLLTTGKFDDDYITPEIYCDISNVVVEVRSSRYFETIPLRNMEAVLVAEDRTGACMSPSGRNPN